MKAIERQNLEFKKLMDETSKENIEYINWISKIYKEYKKELKNRTLFMKFLVFIFGDFNLLGYDIVKQYGKHNLETLI